MGRPDRAGNTGAHVTEPPQHLLNHERNQKLVLDDKDARPANLCRTVMLVHELIPTEELGLFKTVGDVIHNEFSLRRAPRGGLLYSKSIMALGSHRRTL